MKRLLALILSLFLLLGSVSALAESKTMSAPASNVSDTKAPNIIKYTFVENGKTVKAGDVLHFKMKHWGQSLLFHYLLKYLGDGCVDTG